VRRNRNESNVAGNRARCPIPEVLMDRSGEQGSEGTVKCEPPTSFIGQDRRAQGAVVAPRNPVAECMSMYLRRSSRAGGTPGGPGRLASHATAVVDDVARLVHQICKSGTQRVQTQAAPTLAMPIQAMSTLAMPSHQAEEAVDHPVHA